jgi:hypothetical protein
MTFRKFYRHYVPHIIGILLVLAIAYDCGHSPEPVLKPVVRKAGW